MEHVHAELAPVQGHAAAVGAPFLFLFALAFVLYLLGRWRQRARGRDWPLGRSLCFALGLALAAAAVAPPLAGLGHQDLRAHMVQHLLLGMFAPLALVLGAPVSLLLRSLPRRGARVCLALLHSPPLRLLTRPWLALLLNVGGMYLLYLTPLFAAMASSPALHILVHLHFLLAGYLFCWAILAGPDPGLRPARPLTRLGVLFAGMAAHAVLGKLLYAGGWPRGSPVEQVEAAAQWMYYGGDLAEAVLLVVLLHFWRRGKGAPAGLFDAGSRPTRRPARGSGPLAEARASLRRRTGEATGI